MRLSVLKSIAVAASLALAGAASAATVDIEGFESLPAGPQTSWSNNGYTYSPTLRTHGQCYSGFCLNEYNKSGSITTITENNPPGDGLFAFLGLYVNINGSIPKAGNNFLSIIATYADSSTYDMLLPVTSNLSGTGLDVVAFNKDGTSSNKLTFDSNGYFLSFTNNIFQDVRSIELRSLTTGGTIRVDCVASSHDAFAPSLDSTTGGALTQCVPNVSTVPVPASLLLLLGGLGGLAGLSGVRRRKAT